MDIVYPHFVDEAYEVRHNPRHRWFFKRNMEPEDVVVFKMYDSLAAKASGLYFDSPLFSGCTSPWPLAIRRRRADPYRHAAVCPHSAFVDPTVPAGTPHRESIEVKVMAVG